jgi:biopolymer transport protein ExbD
MLLSKHKADSEVKIELTPMIDMVFLLLIFFLVATTFQQEEREMQIALPVASSAGPISASLRELIINVGSEGQIIIAGKTYNEEELKRLVSDSVEANPERKVTVRGDRATVYANVVKVLDICKGAGIQEPYLDTVLEP